MKIYPESFDDNRLTPMNIEAEEAILGGILLDPYALIRVIELLHPEAFAIPSHQKIYRAMVDLHHKGQPTDLMTVTTWLSDHNLIDQVGGTAKLAQLIDRTVSTVNIDRYAILVMDKYIRRQMITAGYQVVNLSYDTAQKLESVVEEAEQTVFDVAHQCFSTRTTVEPLNKILIRNFDELENYYQGLQQPGLTTGFQGLDHILGGLQRQELVIIAGRPSIGKTALGLNLAHNIAWLHQMPVVIFSLEMSKEQLSYRLLSRTVRIECDRLKAGRVSLNEFEVFAQALKELSELPIFIDDRSNPSILEMRAILRWITTAYSQHQPLGMVLVDYLQLMGKGEQNRVQELDQICRELKQIAKDFKVPVVCLSQLNRGVENRQNKRPLISDLRDSGAIEQVADAIALVYRDDYYRPDTTEKGIVEVNIGKQRNGSTGMVKLFFEREYSRFLDLYY